MATTVKANLKAGGLPVQEEQQMEALVGAETLGRLHEKDKIQSRASASSSTTTTTTTIPSLLNDTSDWPCPDLEPCDYHRRPSWQEEEHYLNNRGGGGSSSETTATHSHTTRIHNPFSLSLRTLPPRSVSPGAGAGVSSAIHHQSTAATTTTTTTASSYKKNSNSNSNLKIPQPSHNNKITFLSPFDQHHNNQYAAFLPVPAVEAPLSPFCLPGSPFTDLDMESLASSPGLGTPSSMASGSGSTTGSCYCNGNAAGLGPFDGAAPSSYRQLAPRQPSLQPSDLSPSSSSSHDPSSSSSSATAYLSTSPTSSSKPYYGFRSPSQGNTALDHCMQQSDNNLQYRRRSVDVGTLGNARGHQRHGRTSQADAPAAAFVPPDQLKAHRTRKTNSLRSKEFLFAQHLTSILRHSLSLCSIVAPDADIEAWSNAATPRSSISSMSSNGLPSISDRLEAPVPLHVASSSSSNTTPRRLRLPSLPHIVPQRRAELINMLSSWSFDANLLDLDELCECACIIFECFLESEGLSKETAGTPAKWRTFMVSIRAAYHPQNAYHNFAHAVDVLQACYSFVVHLGVAPPLSRLQEQQQMDGQSRQSKWRRDEKLNERGRIGDILRPLDVLALLVAAIGHDVGHPGLTNAYMINARTPAAQVYDDKSVLENFHSVTLIRMLKIHGFGHLLEESEQGLGTDFRQVLLTSVLVTDMSRHFPFVEKLTQMGERMKINGYRSTEVKEDRLVICSALMKCGDISNPSRPHNVASFWSSALLEEWAVQAEIEAKFELPISVMQLKSDNSNRSDERMAQAKSQVGFINLFTQPLFDKLAAAVPSFQLFADYCAAGRKPWEAIISKLEEQKTETKDEISATLPEASEESKSALSRALSTPPSVSIPEIRISQYKPAPHRLPWSAKTSEFPFDASTPLSPTTVSTFGTSPSTTSSYFKDGRSSPTSSATTFSSSSWIPSNVVEAYHPLAEEACTDNCSSITALCATCARRQRQQWDDADSASASQLTGTCATLVTSGQWPPEPFRPSPATKA